MRTLEVLLKRAKRDMEELAGNANRALAERNRVLTARASCEAATAAEANVIDGSPMSGLGFAAYLDKQKARLAELDKEFVEVEAQHKSAKNALMTAYAEVKKLEALIAQKKLHAVNERNAAEQNAFDERSAQMFRR